MGSAAPSSSPPLTLPPGSGDRAGLLPALRGMADWISAHGLAELPAEHTPLARSPLGLRLRLQAVAGSPWRQVFLSQHLPQGLAMWMTWVDAGGAEGGAFVPPGVSWAMAPLLQDVLIRLGGDEVDLELAVSTREPLLPRGTWVHPDGWWSDWKGRPTGWHAEQTMGDLYRREVYPLVRRLSQAALAGLPAPAVVDVGGGDGELAAALADETGATITLIERNAEGCSRARDALGERHTVVHADASDAATWQARGPFHLALLVGSIHGNVMRPDEAHRVVHAVHTHLRSGGVAIVTGWSPCLMDADALAEVGFEVLNRVVPPADPTAKLRQLTVLRKT